MLVLPKHRSPVPSPRLPGAAADALCRWDTSPDALPRGSPGVCGTSRDSHISMVVISSAS